ncbi:hypothetical protein ACHQM5_005570 [Ranunculus cassubicifolius]
MTTFNFPSFFVPLLGLVFPAIAMASLSLHVQKKQNCLDPISSIFFFSILGLGLYSDYKYLFI